jgi:enoyl-CoA hydratase/carnithine racemase
MSDYQTIRYAVIGHTARITLDRPQVLNAIDPQMLDELGAALQSADDDETVRVLVLTGAGERAFCSGMDLRAFAQRAAETTVLQRRAGRRGYRHPLMTFRKPVIAAINGLAFGGGLELMLLCDLAIAAEGATFAAAEVSRGLIPGNGATQRLPRRVGLAHALEMLLTAKPIDAQKALRIGLVNDVVAGEDLLAAAQRMADAICANGPLAVRIAKEAATRGFDLPLADGLDLETDLVAHVQTSEDAKEGVQAFIEKRKPQWRGR